ncbi:MAG: pseudouridine synthase [Verrucomicrobiota bacterium]
MVNQAQNLRIQKFLADQGICSRRVAEEFIREGSVTINGELAEIGQKIDPSADIVAFEGQRVRPKTPPKVTIAVNKPKGFVCSNDDPNNPRTVFDLLPKEYAKTRLFCAGRLDKDSEGLLILTNDGDLANQLMHPSNHIVKRYKVSLKQAFPKSKLSKLLKGVIYEEERLKVEQAAFLGNPSKDASTEIDVAMHHGKKREIRRLFMALGYDVKTLKRYQIGQYSIKGMPRGAGIELDQRDIKKLFKADIES